MTDLSPDLVPDQEPRSNGRLRRGGLFVTDAELIELLGVPEKIARDAIAMLDRDRANGWPRKRALWGGRRYWPAVRAYLDRTEGLLSTDQPTVTFRDRKSA